MFGETHLTQQANMIQLTPNDALLHQYGSCPPPPNASRVSIRDLIEADELASIAKLPFVVFEDPKKKHRTDSTSVNDVRMTNVQLDVHSHPISDYSLLPRSDMIPSYHRGISYHASDDDTSNSTSTATSMLLEEDDRSNNEATNTNEDISIDQVIKRSEFERECYGGRNQPFGRRSMLTRKSSLSRAA